MSWDYKNNNCSLSQDFKDKYIVNIKGKEYVTVAGLIALGHQKGLKGIKTKILQFPNKDNDNVCIVEATCIGFTWSYSEEKIVEAEYTAIGDASSKSISNATIAIHFIRMAETRAVGRLLRNYTNIGMVAVEEMGSVIEIAKISGFQMVKVGNVMKQNGISKDRAREELLKLCGKAELKETSPDEADEFIKLLQSIKNLPNPTPDELIK